MEIIQGSGLGGKESGQVVRDTAQIRLSQRGGYISL
jgi:hypothetical protein